MRLPSLKPWVADFFPALDRHCAGGRVFGVKKLVLVCSVALLVSVAFRSAASGADTDFPEIIQPFLKEHCIKCHGPEKKKGKLVLHTIKDDFGSEAGSERWIEILNQLTFGEMPPPDEEIRPESSDTAEVVEWIHKRLAESGKADG